VFRGESWFPIEDTVIEQVATQLARAKAHATVSGPRCHECPRNPRSRHSAFFRVFPRPKKAQREILCGAADCIVRVVDCDPGRAKLALSRMPVSPLDRPARPEPRPPKGVPARREPRPPKRRSLALPRGNLGLPPATFLPQPFFQQSRFAFGLSQCRFQIRRQTEGVQ